MVSIDQAAKIIKSSGVVAFPTETVYGLGADATNQLACQKIYLIKGRPSINPLIVHVNTIKDAEYYGKFNNDAYKLSEFWPGPLTLVLKQQNSNLLASCVTANLSTIALRIPAYPTARKLISKSGCPIAAPSANKSGLLSTTSYQHVYSNFLDSIPIIEDKCTSEYGLESTIIDLSTERPTILRLGCITQDMIEKKILTKIEFASKSSKIKSPGMLLKHYAPKTILRLNAIDISGNEIGLNFADSQLCSEYSLNLSPNGDLAEAASNLFKYLYKLDNYGQEHNIQSIAIAPIPEYGIGCAINDRLYRAVGQK